MYGSFHTQIHLPSPFVFLSTVLLSDAESQLIPGIAVNCL